MCKPISCTNDIAKEVSTDPTDVFLDAVDNKHSQIREDKIYPIKDDPEYDEDYFFPPYCRKVLPSPISARRASIWSYVKEFVGKDLTKITLPIFLNEPLSLLHKTAECYGSAQLLQKSTQTHVDRIEMVAANFAVCQSSHSYRTFKPFNPLLGETFELRRDEKKFLFVSEQVCHHPPITAFYSQMPGVIGYGSYQLRISFYGNSVDTVCDGTFTYEFRDSDGNVESIITVIPPVNTSRNIIFGNIWMEKHGIVPIIDHINGHKLMLNFRKKGWFSNRDLFFIDGMIVDKMGKEQRYIYGQWTGEIWSCSPETFRRIEAGLSKRKGPDSKLIAKAIPKLPDAHLYYGMPKFSIALNELRGDMNPPPTDARFRPDIVFLENGDLDRASAEKHRLEEKQRAARRLRETNGVTWTPLWFDLLPNPVTNKVEWRFNYKYLEENFQNCPDIY